MQWGHDSATMGGVIEFVRTHDEAKLPSKAHSDDACFDLFAVEDRELWPGDVVTVDTGFRVGLPKGYAGLVCSRSGLAARNGVFVLNAPGMIDAGYRGNLKVILHNTQERPLKIKAGDRIGQLFIQKVLPFICAEVDEFSDEQTDRGEGGLGSTGS